MQIKADEISKIIEEEIQNYDQRVEMSETGTVLYIGDGIARVSASRTPWPWNSSNSLAASWAWF